MAEDNSSRKGRLQITLCRYEFGRLVKAIKNLHDIEYTAVSHVWGETQWRTIKGVEDEVRVSREKAYFLENQFPAIIGAEWFWMDVMCIDQRDDAARIALTKQIPEIFRNAQKTLAVRETWGVQYCCPEATEDIRMWIVKGDKDSAERIFEHYGRQPMHVARGDEGFLTRLWVFQELLLSDTVQFVRCQDIDYGAEKMKELLSLCSSNTFSTLIFDAWTGIRSLARAWVVAENEAGDHIAIQDDVEKFIYAFIGDGTVSRRSGKHSHDRPRNFNYLDHMFSKRRTSKPRDFILAIMPQYDWYWVPEKARQMTFEELFLDACVQATQKGAHMRPRLGPLITAEWTDLINIVRNPAATTNIPIPECLGDMSRLVCLNIPANDFPGWQEFEVEGQRLTDNLNGPEALEIVKTHMGARRSIKMWMNSFVQTFGVEADLEWFVATDKRGQDEHEQQVIIKVLAYMCNLFILEREPTEAVVRKWERFKMLMNDYLSASCIKSLLLYTAMVSCGLGISAYEWSKKNLTLLLVAFRGVRRLALNFNDGGIDLDKCKYVLVQGRLGAIILACDEDSQRYSRCLFPPQNMFPKTVLARDRQMAQRLRADGHAFFMA